MKPMTDKPEGKPLFSKEFEWCPFRKGYYNGYGEKLEEEDGDEPITADE